VRLAIFNGRNFYWQASETFVHLICIVTAESDVRFIPPSQAKKPLRTIARLKIGQKLGRLF
jgi:hypothetical protein